MNEEVKDSCTPVEPPTPSRARSNDACRATLYVDAVFSRGAWQYERSVQARPVTEWEALMGQLEVDLGQALCRYADVGRRSAHRSAPWLDFAMLSGGHEAARDERIREAAKARGVHSRSTVGIGETGRVRMVVQSFERPVACWACDFPAPYMLQRDMESELADRYSTFKPAEWAGLLAMIELERAMEKPEPVDTLIR